MDRIYSENELSEPDLGSGALRSVAGLTPRQVNEWASRGALPSSRKGARGWRRVNAWQLMSLRIVSQLHSEFGIPIGKLRNVQHWMIGEAPSWIDEIKMDIAKSTANRIAKAVPEEHRELGTRLLALAEGGFQGLGALAEIPWLMNAATPLDNYEISLMIRDLGSTMVPLYGALGSMTTGYPTFLTTDLTRHMMFIDELTLVEMTRQGALPKPCIVVKASDHINAVLESKGMKPIEARMRAAEVESTVELALDEQQEMAVDLIRKRDFDRLIVTNRHGNLRFEVQSDLSAREEAAIIQTLREHDYQTVTIKKSGGGIVRLTQAISMKMPEDRNGKNPGGLGGSR